MSTTAVLPIAEVTYPTVGVTVVYEEEHVTDDRGSLRLFRFTASKDCILYFPNLQDFGIQYLIIRATETETLVHSDERVNIDFQVFTRIDQFQHTVFIVDPVKSKSDPPPINP